MADPTRPSMRSSEHGPRGRVVLENPDGGELWVESQVLERAGFDVRACPGPHGSTGTTCPLIATGRCEHIEEADVVISSLRVTNPTTREIVAAIRLRYPDTPLVLDATPAEQAAEPDLLADLNVVFPLTADSLLHSVEQAVATRASMRADPVELAETRPAENH